VLAPQTQVIEERVKTILAGNDSPDIGFDLSINPYRGCEHGCIYCYARPTHSYLNLSPGLDFETRIIAKVNAAERLARRLGAAQLRTPAAEHRLGHRRLPAGRATLAHHALR
jgi:DNA repair photolyase